MNKQRKPPRKEQTRYAVLIDYSTGEPVRINVHSEAVLEDGPIKRWQLHWIGTSDKIDYGQVGQLGIFHQVVPLTSSL